MVIKGGRGNLIPSNEAGGQLSWIEELLYLVIAAEKCTGFLLRELRVWKLECFVTLDSCCLSRLKSKAKVTCC